MSYRGTGRARVDVDSPRAFASCDRCGALRNHEDLTWQFDYRGNFLANLRLLVCKETERCNDTPNQLNRPVILPPDPMPIQDARPEPIAQEMTPSSAPYPPPQTAANLIQAANEDEFG